MEAPAVSLPAFSGSPRPRPPALLFKTGAGWSFSSRLADPAFCAARGYARAVTWERSRAVRSRCVRLPGGPRGVDGDCGPPPWVRVAMGVAVAAGQARRSVLTVLLC